MKKTMNRILKKKLSTIFNKSNDAQRISDQSDLGAEAEAKYQLLINLVSKIDKSRFDEQSELRELIKTIIISLTKSKFDESHTLSNLGNEINSLESLIENKSAILNLFKDNEDPLLKLRNQENNDLEIFAQRNVNFKRREVSNSISRFVYVNGNLVPKQ